MLNAAWGVALPLVLKWAFGPEGVKVYDPQKLLFLVFGLAGVFCLIQGLRWYATFNGFGALGFQHQLKLRCSKHIQKLSVAQMDQLEMDKVRSVVNSDVPNIASGFAATNTLISNFFEAIGLGYLLFVLLDASLTLVVCLVIAVGWTQTQVFNTRIMKSTKAYSDAEGNFNFEIDLKMDVHNVMQASSLYDQFDARIQNRFKALAANTGRVSAANRFYDKTLETTLQTAFLTAILMGMILANKGLMELPSLVAVIGATGTLNKLVGSMAGVSKSYATLRVSLLNFLCMEKYNPMSYNSEEPGKIRKRKFSAWVATM